MGVDEVIFCCYGGYGVWLCRLCGYDKNYLSLAKSEKSEGSQKLLHWSCADVGEWLSSIQLEQYVTALDRTGIHGPVMVTRQGLCCHGN